MKIYILQEFVYSTSDGTYANIIGAYKSKANAEKEQNKLIKDNIENYGFIRDEETHKTTIIFLGFQENWDNYIEYEIIETELK